MPAEYRIEWHPQAFQAQIQAIADHEVDLAAVKVVAAAEPPIDTGFLRASGYVNSSTGFSTFDNVPHNGRYVSRHTGLLADRSRADTPQPPPRRGAVAAWAADYSLAIEERTAFIYQAVQTVASQVK